MSLAVMFSLSKLREVLVIPSSVITVMVLPSFVMVGPPVGGIDCGERKPGSWCAAGFLGLCQGERFRGRLGFWRLVRFPWLCLGFLAGAPYLVPEGLLVLLGFG